MERVSVARMATAKLQGWIHAARGMGVSASVATKRNRYCNQSRARSVIEQAHPYFNALEVGPAFSGRSRLGFGY
jgi:hypothetical protein